MGRGDRRHYNLVQRRHKAEPGEGQAAKSGVEPSLGRIVWRESRCPGCHGRVSLKYRMEKMDDGGYNFHLLSPSVAHPACEVAVEEIRRASPIWFRREINA